MKELPASFDIMKSTERAAQFEATHRHIKSGGPYQFISYCIIEKTLTEGVIYMDITGRLWVRPREEFEDGRFAPIEDSLSEKGDLPA